MKDNDVIPHKDEEFDIFQSILYSAVSPNLTAFGIPTTSFNTITTLKAVWDTAWATARNKKKRSGSDVETKDTARASYVSAIRLFIKQWLAFNTNISDSQRIAMGLHVYNKKRTPASDPDTTPLMVAQHGNGGTILILFKQQPGADGTKRKGKPDKIARFEFCYTTGTTAPKGPEECLLFASATRSPLELNFTSVDSGKWLYGYGRWINTRNKPGKWTTEYVSIHIL